MLHVDPFSVADFRRLDGVRGDHCVSIYLPTHTVSREADQDKILFKNLLRTAILQLEDAKADKRRVAMLAGQLEGLDDDLAFWNHMANGLAVFVTPDSLEYFRLPRVVSEEVEVSDRFHIKPLVPLLAFPHTAYVLEISLNQVRFWEVSECDMHQVEIAGMPTSFDNAMEQRTGQPTADGESVRMRQDEERKVRQRQFTRDVAQSLEPFLLGRTTPLVLAGVETMLVYYRESDTYAHTVETTISGNQEHRRRDEFASEARAIAAHRFEAEIRGYLDRVDNLRQKRLSSTDFIEISQAAREGRIQLLIVDVERELYGKLGGKAPPATGAQASAATYDLLDEIVSLTVRHGGEVIGLRENEMPDGVKAAATFRYTE